MNKDILSRIDPLAPKTKIEIGSQKTSLFLLVLMFLFTLLNFLALPSRIATHYNFAGEPDGWGSKWTIWLVPILSVAIYFILGLTIKIPPAYYNFPVKLTPENVHR